MPPTKAEPLELIDLDAGRESAKRKPFQVRLGGETFTCVANVPAGPYLRLFRPMVGGDEVEIPMLPMIHAVLVDEDIERFDAMLERKVDPIDAEDVIVLTNLLVERYSQRPTEPPSGSSDGRQPTSNGSTAKHS